MKIAIASENGKTISKHFGKATQYVVINTEDGKIVSREVRPKISHFHSDCLKHKKCKCECQNQCCEASVYDRHRSMIINILDCSVLLTGGMGPGVRETLTSRRIKAVITKSENIEEAVKLYLNDNLTNTMNQLN
jgi:predicted Fe-Mo cluster-binding NifX family protein